MIKPWLIALRPKTLSAAVVPILVATALVYVEGEVVHWWITICALISSLFIQIGTNLVNDVIDFKKGADTATRLGPKRVTQSGLISGKSVMIAALVCFIFAAAFGLPLVFEGGWPIAIVGLLSLFFAYGYTGGPFPLAYLGLGDLFVVIFFGVVAVCGVYYLHLGSVSGSALIAGVQVGLLATVLIAINNLRDRLQDIKVLKKTLAVRFGHNFVLKEILFLNVTAFGLQSYWIVSDQIFAGILPLLVLPMVYRILTGLVENPEGPVYNQFLAQAGGVHMLFGIQISLGFLVGTVI